MGSRLTVARTVALMHGGGLGATSTLGQGSTFSLRLPVAERGGVS